jgi:hypothetical protein
MTLASVHALIAAMHTLRDDIRRVTTDLKDVGTATTRQLNVTDIQRQHMELREQGVEIADLVQLNLQRLKQVLSAWDDTEDPPLFTAAVECGFQLKEEESQLCEFDLCVGQQLGNLAWCSIFT